MFARRFTPRLRSLCNQVSSAAQVSNDGHGYSNAKILTLYDGACQICSLDTEGMCRLRVRRLLLLSRLVCVITAATAHPTPNVIFMSTRFRPVSAFCRVPLPATCDVSCLRPTEHFFFFFFLVQEREQNCIPSSSCLV